MTIVVTGSTGFIGHRVAERLLQGGRTVRCPVRSPDRARDLAGAGAEVLAADLLTGHGIDEALRGAAAVVHLAGVVRAWGREAFFATNVEGTRRLAEAAARAGVRRFVLVSSLAAAGPGAPEAPVVEETAPRPVNSYGESKLAAERALAASAGPMEWSVVRPCAVYGPRDRDFLVLFRLIARRRIIPYTAPAGAALSLVHVEDLTDLIIAALDRAPAGGCYLAAGEGAHGWAGVIEAIGRAVGREVRPVRIPPLLLWPAAAASGILRPFTARPPIFCLDKLREARERSWVASADRARRELGWRPRIALDEGMRSTAEWYRGQGWL